MTKKDINIYKKELEKYIKNIKKSKININASKLRLELQFESLSDWSQINNFDYIKKWFNHKRKKPGIKVQRIPLHECKKWSYDKKKGKNLVLLINVCFF